MAVTKNLKKNKPSKNVTITIRGPANVMLPSMVKLSKNKNVEIKAPGHCLKSRFMGNLSS